MRELLNLCKEFKWIPIVAIGVILLVIVLTVHAFSVQANKAKQQAAPNASTNTQPSEVATGLPQATTGITSKIKLTASQQKIVDAYSTDEKNFVSLLAANVWAISGDDNDFITFSSNSYSETIGGKTTTKPFIITALSPDTITGDSTTYNATVASVSNGSGTFIVKLSQWQTVSEAGNQTGPWQLISSMFSQQNTAYEISKPAKVIKINGATEELGSYFGSTEKLETALKKYISINYPSASAATWQQQITINYSQKVITTQFNLNDMASTPITVSWSMDKNTIQIAGVGV